ncbi:MAG: hypothetical protein MUE59_15595 [Thiobacillaceae bacterium]|nr:hypothetical protein [Thiobacillaceae bacterium]
MIRPLALTLDDSPMLVCGLGLSTEDEADLRLTPHRRPPARVRERPRCGG